MFSFPGSTVILVIIAILADLSIVDFKGMISVVIPTCERTEALARCLESLQRATEIIVSDDSQTSETHQLILARFPKVKWIQGPRRGPAANRNHGAAWATGEWLAFLDDDCIPDRTWLDEIARAIPTSDVIEGRTVCLGRTNHPLEEIVENLTGDLLWSCNLAIRRDLFETLGRFDEDFREAGGEDLELAFRIRQNKLVVSYVPEAVVYHPPRRLPVSRWIRRTFQSRWHLLYEMKTMPTDRVRQERTGSATFGEIIYLLRSTGRIVLLRERTQILQRAFRLGLTWSLLPVLVPYLLYWEIAFKKQTNAR
jgi:GT2 family glycosyltransferase